MSQIRAYIGPSRCPLAHSGLVLSHASLMCDESQLAEMLDPDRTTRHGHRQGPAYDPVTRMEDVLQAGSAPRGERWGEDRDTDYERAYGPCLTWN